ncbi:predicted protein [Nematostella vectensis]|uniref:Coiled-coil domain-containing protein 169 n=1 Tax=Nematostella vectensis TaxID=45351 RepID=A7SE60_NEMVE|nr:coiled-coil domain-containing protein 169 [Nematostella vectensis]EDO37982.1 predicted protein [Nematostella vectensis]|eukprot:XP_001630045.1 predicted protein [Nematostella vectensis]
MRGFGLGSTDITRLYSSSGSEKKKEQPKTRLKPAERRPSVAPKAATMAKDHLSRAQKKQTSPKSEMDYEIERLRAEIQQEKQMKEMLEQSSEELDKTIVELQGKFEIAGDEDNEWKTRFETQHEMNTQLEKQIILLRDKLEQMKIPSREGKPHPLRTYNGLTDADVKKLMRQTERDKLQLEGQLRDLEWRLDNESKAYHKISEERKQYFTALNETSAVIDDTKTKRKHALIESQRNSEETLARFSQATMRKIDSNSSFGLPDNQRIIDPKKGPIKKTAAVRKLPKIQDSA